MLPISCYMYALQNRHLFVVLPRYGVLEKMRIGVVIGMER